jgi:hypothetical protein
VLLRRGRLGRGRRRTSIVRSFRLPEALWPGDEAIGALLG